MININHTHNWALINQHLCKLQTKPSLPPQKGIIAYWIEEKLMNNNG